MCNSSEAQGKNQNSKKKVIQVILLRHGEREDEAWINDKKLSKVIFRSAKSWIDPYLTVKGHVQAREAFQALSSSSSLGKTMVFCSPTRRTLATAMGITNYDDDATKKDVYVLNGLCECAGFVRALGGSERLSDMGWLVGATKENQELKRKILQEMRLRHKTSTITFQNEKYQDPSVQFWIPSQSERNDTNSEIKNDDIRTFEPMFQSKNDDNHRDNRTNNNYFGDKIEKGKQLFSKRRSTSMGKKKELPQNLYIQSVQNAVILAERNGNDTCIIVTHREGIQNLVHHTTSTMNEDHEISTPYCAVASFSATLTEKEKIDWMFHNVSSYQDFKTPWNM